MPRPRVALLGASGTMGHEAFKELWRRRDQYDIVLLLLPLQKSKALFRKYEQQAVPASFTTSRRRLGEASSGPRVDDRRQRYR